MAGTEAPGTSVSASEAGEAATGENSGIFEAALLEGMIAVGLSVGGNIVQSGFAAVNEMANEDAE